MKIAHFVYSLQVGGMERIVVDLSKCQKNRGHEVYVFCITNSDISLESELADEGIDVYKFNKGKGFDIKLIFKIIRILRFLKIDVAHTHNPVANFYGVICGRLASVKVILNTRHGMGNFPYNRKRELIFKICSFLIDKNVFVCKKAKDNFIKFKIVSATKSVVVYNGIPINKFEVLNKEASESLRRDLKIDKNQKVVGTVARLERAKDLSTLIDSAKLVINNMGNVIFIIVGYGSEMDKLKNLTKKHDIEKNILFLGKRIDIANILSLFDIFVLSSISEGASITLIEAMALKKAIVATDVGGNPEIVEDGKTGFVVAPQKPELFSQSIIKLLKNNDARILMGEAGYSRAQKFFDIENTYKRYLDIYSVNSYTVR